MSAKKALPIVDPEIEEATPEAQPEAIRIVSLEEATNPDPEPGVRYWIGQPGPIPFEDGTTYVAQGHLNQVSDPTVIKKLDQMAKFPGNPYKIFKQ